MEEKQSRPTISLIKDGPIKITGNYTISDEANSQIDAGTEVYLCRCGNSGNKPYCDGSHKSVTLESTSKEGSCD